MKHRSQWALGLGLSIAAAGACIPDVVPTSTSTGASTGTGGGTSTSTSASSTGGGQGGCTNPATNCPPAPNECVEAVCDATHRCAVQNVASGKPVSGQMPGDCMQIVCDGSGGTMSVPANDPPTDPNECMVDSCSQGALVQNPQPTGTACTQDGQVCNGAGKCVLNLETGWEACQDANASPNNPAVVLESSSVTSATVQYIGGTAASCGCNCQRLTIALHKTYSCSQATLEFDYATQSANFTSTNSASLDIRFLTGPGPTTPATSSTYNGYGGSGFLGSEWAGTSNCAVRWAQGAANGAGPNVFPSVAQIHDGPNVQVLAAMDTTENDLANINGWCGGGNPTGTFDTIEVHMQGYACYNSETAITTLSNLRVHQP